jgi:hypothetical protein
MFSRTVSVRAAGLPALGAALLLASTVIALSAENRVRLGADVLAQSRGNNQGSTLIHPSCSDYNGNIPCYALGAGKACALCNVNTYTDFGGAEFGGYKHGTATQNCGTNISGICVLNNANQLVCDTSNGNPIQTCNTPPNVTTQ